MQSSISIFLAALLSYGAVAQKGQPLPQIITVSKAQPTTRPRAIDESDRKKECPPGFAFIGKQCGKTLIEQPNVLCPKGTILIDGRCVTYYEKDSECPPGFTDYNGICRKSMNALKDIFCPEGYILRGKDICVTTVALPEKSLCPPGSIPKGDGCAVTKPESPDYVCPTGYTLIGKRCQREETFDCTPPRNAREIEEPSKNEHIRHPFSKGKEDNVYRLPASQPIVEEYVIRKTCKRIITEAARPVCPKGGNFNGKVCLVDVLVSPVSKPGGFKEETLPPQRVCPEGFEETLGGDCIANEEIMPNPFCPPGTIDIGDKCATYLNPKTVCPEGYFLDGKVCAKTIFAAPLVEYTVTYACTGKDCGENHNHVQSHGKHHH